MRKMCKFLLELGEFWGLIGRVIVQVYEFFGVLGEWLGVLSELLRNLSELLGELFELLCESGESFGVFYA